MSDGNKALSALPPVGEYLKKHSILTKKAFGQHFIFDLNLTRKIAICAGDLSDCTVLEIGPGPGALTRSILAMGAKKLVVIEKDERMLPILNEIKNAVGERLEIIHADALEILEENFGPKIKIIANLPYNISTELLFKWLDKINLFESLTLMFQKEVASRIAAKPNTKDYGRISVIAQWLAETKREFDIPPGAFVPPPKITSTVLNIIPYSQPLYPAKMGYLKTVTKAFGQRRKILRGSLKQITSEPEKLLEMAGINPGLRPEALTVQDFCKLASALESLA